jgi:hypothetical protein
VPYARIRTSIAKLGGEAWLTAQQQTWDRNAEAVWQLLEEVAARKHSTHALHGNP